MQLDLDVDTRRQIELHQLIDRHADLASYQSKAHISLFYRCADRSGYRLLLAGG